MTDLLKKVVDDLDIFIRPAAGLVRKPAPYYIMAPAEASEPSVGKCEYSFAFRIESLEY
jgi:hypothetical protein